MPILFPMNCERTNLFSVKRDLEPLYRPQLTAMSHVSLRNINTDLPFYSGKVKGY